MMSRSKLIVKHPRDLLHATLVTNTWELARHLDDIASATLDEEATHFARHVWRARPNVPTLLAPHVDDDHFSWTAEVNWSNANFESDWRIEPHALRESMSCSARVTLNKALGGRATQIAFNAKLSGLDGRQGVETIAYRIVLVNWQKLVDAAVRELETAQLT